MVLYLKCTDVMIYFNIFHDAIYNYIQYNN